MPVTGTENALRGETSRVIVAIAKKLMPHAAANELRRFREFSKAEQRIYLRTKIRDSIRLSPPRIPTSAHSFLFLCYGNIIRSPMCEMLMKRELAQLRLDGFLVTSAGLNATAGRPAHPWALAAARNFGISLDRHRARPLTQKMVDSADVIFVMDYQNYVQLFSRWQPDRKKVFMLSAYMWKGKRLREIADPYYLGERETIACYQMLEVSTRNLLSQLQCEGAKSAVGSSASRTGSM